MLRVIYSNQTEELLCALAERISADPGRVVVPSRNLRAYVELGVARLAGIATDVESRALADFLTSIASGPTPEPVFLDRLLVALFDDALLDHPELSAVRDYVRGAGDDPLVTERRRVQLARKLARLFSQYDVFRPELLECWRAGLRLDDSDFREVETWQRRLWLAIEGSLPRPSAPPETAPRVAHLFGFSSIARSLIVALGRIAETSDVFLYTLNPCQELWEAIAGPAPLREGPTRYERRSGDLGPGEVFSIEDPFRLSNPGESLPLRLWGKPGRENLRLLNALTGCELVARMRDPEGSSLLNQLQRDIVSRKPDRGALAKPSDVEPDESIVFLECSSPRRELEVIAAEIWSTLSESAARDGEDRLRFEDIAVLFVPSQAARYQSLVEAVFREARDIPHRIEDLPLENESSFADAVLQLLAIPLGSFTVSSLVRFATHPAVMASFPGSTSEEWARFADELRRGGNEVIDWDRRLKQLALGIFLDGPSLPKARSRAIQSAADFGMLFRSLLADAKDASRATMTLPAWMDLTSALLATYLEPRSEADELVLRQCLDAVSSVAELDLSGRKVRYGVAHELVDARIRELSGCDRFLTKGVWVGPLLSLRAIPFRVVFVAGLSAPHFPAREDRDQLDLRRANRRAGDVSQRDEDRYAFLETLLSVRDRIYLSWVSRDRRSPEPIPPSSVVSELVETIGRGYASEERLSLRRHPTERSEDPRTRGVVAEAARESNARALGEHLRGHLGVARLPALSQIEEIVTDPVARTLRWSRARRAAPRASAGNVTIDLDTVREFLECPLQGSARFHLRLRDGEGEWSNGTERGLAVHPGEASLVLNVSSRRIEILRRAEVGLGTPQGLLQPSPRHRERFHPQKESLKGFLDHVFSCAAGLGAAEPYTVVAPAAPTQEDVRTILVRFAPIEPDRARAYLAQIIADLLSGVHEYVLPCEAVFGSIDPVKLDRTSSGRGPVPHPEDYPRLVEPERESVVQRRFGLYFQVLLPGGESA